MRAIARRRSVGHCCPADRRAELTVPLKIVIVALSGTATSPPRATDTPACTSALVEPASSAGTSMAVHALRSSELTVVPDRDRLSRTCAGTIHGAVPVRSSGPTDNPPSR